MSSLWEVFTHDFMLRALVAGVALALAAALVGVPQVLKRNAMLGDGLAHVVFGAFAVATVLNFAPLVVVLPVALLVAFLLSRLTKKARFYTDAVLAALSVSALAIGTCAVSLAGSNLNIDSYLFGSILSISQLELVLGVGVALLTLLFYLLCSQKVFALSFDEAFAAAVGVKVGAYKAWQAAITALVIVLGMRLVGALLISGLMVLPVLTARTFCNSFKSMLWASALIALGAFIVGLLLSYMLSTPAGATIVLANLGCLLVSQALVWGFRS